MPHGRSCGLGSCSPSLHRRWRGHVECANPSDDVKQPNIIRGSMMIAASLVDMTNSARDSIPERGPIHITRGRQRCSRGWTMTCP